MGTRAFIGFRTESGEVVATTVQLDGGYKWLGAEALKTYINTNLEEMKTLFKQMRWVNPLPDSKDDTEEARGFYAKYNRKGKVIIDILKSKELEKAKILREQDNPNDFGFGVSIPPINGDYSVSNIEKNEKGEWVATFIKSLDVAKDSYLFGYLYDLKHDTLEVYASKKNNVKTDKPVFEEKESRFRLVQTFKLTRNMNVRKLLKIFEHADQVSEWYEEKEDKAESEFMWEEDVISNMDFLIKNVIKEEKERRIFKLEIPIQEENE